MWWGRHWLATLPHSTSMSEKSVAVPMRSKSLVLVPARSLFIGSSVGSLNLCWNVRCSGALLDGSVKSTRAFNRWRPIPKARSWAKIVGVVLVQAFRGQAMRFGAPDLPRAHGLLGWWEVIQ